jgi:putative transposase
LAVRFHAERAIAVELETQAAPSGSLVIANASIGSMNRTLPRDILVIFNERHLRRVLSCYVDYYQRTRTHLSLDKDCPDPRPVMPPGSGRVVAISQVNGLHHRYERLAA